MHADPKTLVRRLSPPAVRALEAAVGAAASAGHFEITIEHVVHQLLGGETGEVALLLAHLRCDRASLAGQFARKLNAIRGGHTGKPSFSESVFEWFEEAWMLGSLEFGDTRIRTGVLFAQLLRRTGRYLDETPAELEGLVTSALLQELPLVLAQSTEIGEGATSAVGKGGSTGQPAPDSDSAIARFTTNFTTQAREGRIDPVLGRHREIRQLIDILSRRRKNNPVIVGEPGVGKTALVEGFALAVAQGEVPPHLADSDVLSLDLGALQAGASVRGEFENRLKNLISEIKASPRSIVLFIDEAHMLIGAGGSQGGSDAANLLKPALARGELRTIAATTWAEYKKYFEKDAALERRFQPVKVDEPDEEAATAMLRGLRARFEDSHGVMIRDEAVVQAVRLSSRYISGRQMPDKAIDLLDMTAARVRVSMKARPEPLVALENTLAALEREESVVARDAVDDARLSERLPTLRERIAALQADVASMRERWETERSAVEAWQVARKDAKGPIAPPAVPEHDRLVHYEVDGEAVAQAVSAWTGIPAGRMGTDIVRTSLALEDHLGTRVYGQIAAVKAVSDAVRMSQSGIRNPTTPLGVLLFVGPTGVGKTEMALALADLLYGGERFLTVINMTEFQEKHTVSRLIGSPPGYVGYGQGGVLTEAVRQRPYSVVLLDECEKADLEVMNLFYQVFDKGSLSDGEGRGIDFRNTLVVLTSNLGSDTILERSAAGLSGDALVEAIRPELTAHFKPALLARMTIVPFGPVGETTMRRIVDARLDAIRMRVHTAHGIDTLFTEQLVNELVRRSARAETGARTVDHVLRGSLMPVLARFLLERMTTERPGDEPISVSLGDDGEFHVHGATS